MAGLHFEASLGELDPKEIKKGKSLISVTTTMQNVSFKSIDDFIEYLPENEREIVEYYYRHSRICFIWPSSVPWGNVKLDGVQFGFCNGYLLIDKSGYLEKGNRYKSDSLLYL